MIDKARYGGRKGQEWNSTFIEYIEFIAGHPTYEGMPDTYLEDGRVQWEAPSNRPSGRFKNTHHKRKDWWRGKAHSVEISPASSKWISKVALLIHPTKQKPCKRCGNVMDLRYVYPNVTLLKRISNLTYIDDSFPLSHLEHIESLVVRLVSQFGLVVFTDLPVLLKTSAIQVPRLESDLETWLRWIEKKYVPKRPSLLGPGAMSNAPDRFDGFHSFNRCCREEADKGRHKVNMQTYVTDRRVFEYWTEGDWIAANRLMGMVRAIFGNEPCRNGHDGPCSADHIGPISLGFIHRPEFQLLCKPCNSAKNNRMSLSDVEHLRNIEQGEKVISWHSEALWNLRKNSVTSDETARRLSKLLRDNRHNLMYILQRIAREGYFTFLASFLELEYAERDVEFINPRVTNYITEFDEIQYINRDSRYVDEQKSRRFRVAFESLRDYFLKENRNAYIINDSKIEIKISCVLSELKLSKDATQYIDQRIAAHFANGIGEHLDEEFRLIVEELPPNLSAEFVKARQHLENAMKFVAEELSNMWEDERYIRDDAMSTLDMQLYFLE